jgi:hypothetical protein
LGVILLNHLRQGDSGSSETPQHSPVVLEDFLLLLLGGVLTVYFVTPNMFITLWFGFDYGTNLPLGTLII